MNSLLGGLGNSFLTSFKPAAAPMAQPNILMMAVGAAMRGEDPHTFMQNLAGQHPLLRQYDLSNLPAAAQQVCQQNNVNMQDMVNRIDNAAGSIIK